MIHRIARKLEMGKKLLLAAIAAAALIAPVIFGLLHPEQGHAQDHSTNTNAGASGFASVMIRPNKTGAVMPQFHIKDPVGDFVVFKTTDGRFLANNATLHMLIRVAYDVIDSQVVGGPEWVNQERYDVDAKFLNGMDEAKFLSLPMEERSRLMDQRKTMLQALWADRFKLKIHRETQNVPVYSLIVASGGPKMAEATLGNKYPNGFKFQGGAMGPGIWASQDQVFGQGVSMSALAQHLSQRLGQQVADNTGLKGNFDFTLHWKAADNQVVSTVDSMEQLGLQLVPQTGPVEMIVIDRAEPAETVAGTTTLVKPVSAQISTQTDSQSSSSAFVNVSITPKGTPAPNAPLRTRISQHNGNAEFENQSLKSLLRVAFGVDDSQISGGPDWISSNLYDMTITAGKTLHGDEFKQEFQQLLMTRFEITFHRELRPLPVYELRIGSNGSKLLEEAPGNNRGNHFNADNGTVTASGVRIKELVDFLQPQLGRPVVDKTGLKGTYDFAMTVENWQKTRKLDNGNDPQIEALMRAVSEQLGLELKPANDPVEVLVIDHAEQISSARIAQNH